MPRRSIAALLLGELAEERLQNRGHLHLADGVVALAGQHVGERELPRLELALELCPLPARLGGLLESLLALFLRQDGKRHTHSFSRILAILASGPETRRV